MHNMLAQPGAHVDWSCKPESAQHASTTLPSSGLVSTRLMPSTWIFWHRHHHHIFSINTILNLQLIEAHAGLRRILQKQRRDLLPGWSQEYNGESGWRIAWKRIYIWKSVQKGKCLPECLSQMNCHLRANMLNMVNIKYDVELRGTCASVVGWLEELLVWENPVPTWLRLLLISHDFPQLLHTY